MLNIMSALKNFACCQEDNCAKIPFKYGYTKVTFLKKESTSSVSSKFCLIFQSTVFIEYPRITASH